MPSPEMTEARRFFEAFAEAEHAAHVATYREPSDAAHQEAMHAALAYFHSQPGHPMTLGFGRRPGMSAEEVAGDAQMGDAVRQRVVFRIERYEREPFPPLFVAYLGANRERFVPGYDQRYFAAKIGGELRILSREGVVPTEDGSLAWEHLQGTIVDDLGEPAELLNLVEPEVESHRAHYRNPGSGEHGPGVRLFAALTGESPDEIAANPEAFTRGMRVIGDQLLELVGMYFSDDEERRAAARARFAGLRRTLREHGIAVRVDDDAEAPPPPAPAPSPPPEGDPGDAFRGRLRTILQGAVDRLEALKDEVIPEPEADAEE